MTDEDPSPAKSSVSFLLALAIAITLLFVFVIWDFLLALVIAAVLAGCTRPVHDRFARLFRGREGAAAALTVLLTLAMFVVPALLLLGVLMQDAVQISERIEPWIAGHVREPAKLQKAIEESPTLQKLLPYQDQIIEKVGGLAGKAATFLAQAVVSGVTGAAQFFLMLFVTLYAMFFFLKDGRRLLEWTFDGTPLSAGDRLRLVETFRSVARATLKGTVVIGIVQGGLAAAAFAFAGIENVVFWGAIMAVLSVIPGIGAALVWVPAVIYLAVIDRTGAAIGLAAWCAIVVGTADNFLRPLLVGKDTKMPDLMVLLTTLGGLVVLGAVGIVVGPIVGAMFTAGWALWGAAAKEAASPSAPDAAAPG